MAHANLHMAAGMALGTALTMYPVARAWVTRAPLARPVGRMLLAAYGLGIWALIPNLISAAGGPASIHHAFWSNIFLGHALIDRRKDGGLLIGELVMVAVLFFQFSVLLLALRRTPRARDASRPPASSRPAPPP